MQKTVAKHKEEQNELVGLLRALLDLFVMILDKHLCRPETYFLQFLSTSRIMVLFLIPCAYAHLCAF